MKSVAAAEAAALAAWRVTSLGDRVGAIVFGDDDIVEIKPQGRDAGVVRVLGEVVRQNRALGQAIGSQTAPQKLNEALQYAVRAATHDWLICLISDAAGADDETARLITRLCAHNDVLAIYVHDLLEQSLPDVGPAVFSSALGEIEIDSSAQTLRSRFSREHDDWRAQLAELSRHRAIPVLPISTDRDVARQLRELIGKRTQQRATAVRNQVRA